MKTKTPFSILFTAFLITTNLSFSQVQRTIDIISSDTVLLKPISYVYQISFGEPTSFMGVRLPKDNNEALTAPPPVEEIENLLKKKQFSYNISEENDYSVSEDNTFPTIYVQLNNNSELKRLYQAIKDEKGITGKIKEISYEPVSAHFEELFKKLYADALSQATIMAKLTGNSIAKLLSVSEIQDEYGSYMEMYRQVLKNMPSGLFGDSGITPQKVERKFSFKFELK